MTTADEILKIVNYICTDGVNTKDVFTSANQVPRWLWDIAHRVWIKYEHHS